MYMKRELKQIYDDLSKGTLSPSEALDRIKTIKLGRQDCKTGVLLAAPVWLSKPMESSAPLPFDGHHAILCELAQVDARQLTMRIPQSQSVLLEAGAQANISRRFSDYALACFERIRMILESKPQGKVLVQVVAANQEEQTLFAGLSGLLKTAALENPRFVGQLILVPSDITAGDLARCLQAEKAGQHDCLVRYEKSERQTLCWREIDAGAEKPPIVFRENGVYLITGGLGSLGRLFAEEILERTGDARVILTGRTELNAEKQVLFDGLPSGGGRLSYQRVDLCDSGQVNRLIDAGTKEHGRLNGIIHTAGMIADNFILKKTSIEFAEVLAPKVTGTCNLDQATRSLELDFFVLFSSAAGAIGNPGQADYASANSFMDHFAEHRNRLVSEGLRQGRTRSINWGLWESGGIRMEPATQELVRQTTGTQPMRASTGVEAFYRSLAMSHDQIMVAEGDPVLMRRTLLAGKPVQSELPDLLTAIEQSSPAKSNATAIDPTSLLAQTQEYLCRQCSELLKLPARQIDPQAPLEKYGIDSILAMKLTNQLEQTFGVLSKTLFFEYQTIGELSRYFVQSHSARLATLLTPSVNENGSSWKPAEPVVKPVLVPARLESSRRFSRRRNAVSVPEPMSDSIAIIGLSGRYPEAVDLDAYWQNLCDGKDCIMEVPKERWNWREYFSEDRSEVGHHYSKWGGFIAGVDEFDPLFFKISPKEAKYMDPQERLFLQHAWMAVEDAGYTRAGLNVPCDQETGQVGVYVGLMYSEYQLFGAEASLQGKRIGIAGSPASIANRVSYVLNLHGPSMTLDTMCSSSLSAIHVACQDLRLGRTSLAIAGGVNVSIHPNKYLVLSGGQFISSDGHCQSFGEGGDGYIPGEGVGVAVLKRLSEAKRDGDHIYGVIRASVLNHGGKTNGYTVPNPQAQSSAISKALAEAGIDARHVSYIEAHGTGTKLGDPIEIAALSKVFQRYTQEREFCLIGSAKSNIGHCESAAGIAGLTKVLLQMQHRQIVPSLHSQKLNPHIDFPGSPFVVNQVLRPWEPPVVEGRTLPRIAGISSFGAGGSNAHMIVEEYRDAAPAPQFTGRAAILLSARTTAQLQQKAKDLLDFIHQRRHLLDVSAMAYTLQVGREAMEERLGFIVGSIDQLVDKLRAFVSGAPEIEDAYQSEAKRNKAAVSLFSTDADLQQTVDKWIAGQKLSRLLELWANGLEIDWSKLYGGARPPRISLPTYPFARERYWIDLPASPQVSAKSSVSATSTQVLHPLLHRNTSDLNEQRYSSTFTGEEFFLADQQLKRTGIHGQKVLPEAACLEMVRAAIEQAWPDRPPEHVLQLCNHVWARPIVVDCNTQINIALSTAGETQIDYEIYSQHAGAEIVHCQGHITYHYKAAPEALDLGRLKSQMAKVQTGSSFDEIVAVCQGDDQLLAQIRLTQTSEAASTEYLLHPILLDRALQACNGLLAGESGVQQLSSLRSVLIFSRCTQEMFVWGRRSLAGPADSLDIDLCDEQGRICVQMQGICWRPFSMEITATAGERTASSMTSAPAKETAVAGRIPREIALRRNGQARAVQTEEENLQGVPMNRPARLRGPITLAKAKPAVPAGKTSARLSITLPKSKSGVVARKQPASARSSVRLYDCGQGILSIGIDALPDADVTQRRMIGDLLEALDKAQQENSIKVLVLRGIEHCFGHGTRVEFNEAVEQKLFQTIVSFPWPIIAALPGDVIGPGFLAAALCDFMVCSESAIYGYTNAQNNFYPSTAEWDVFAERFTPAQAQDLLYVSPAATGKQLQERGWTCPIMPCSQVESFAGNLAATLAKKPQESLRLLKQHLTRGLTGLVDCLESLENAASAHSSEAVARRIVSNTAHIQIDASAKGVVVIQLGRAGVEDLVNGLNLVFAEIQQDSRCKAIVLASENEHFLPETEQSTAENAVQVFRKLLLESQIPVVAALERGAKGYGWLVSQFCDACISSQSGVYSSASVGLSPVLSQAAVALFSHRFGNAAGKQILLTGAEFACMDLKQRAGTLQMVEQSQVLPVAVKLAESWAEMPRQNLIAWKRSTANAVREKLRNVPPGLASEENEENSAPATVTIALQSAAVSVAAHPGGVVVVKMEDRQVKNMFSPAFLDGLTEAFAHIERTPSYKVVVLTGYDNYFASGGTKESLLAVQAGLAKFTDAKVFQVALDCKLPVIAAMQGHGIGAGWSLGMFADLVLLSEESRYVSPYMDYGFTPGAGATWILADKMGNDLARESLLTGEHYAGSELKQRGLAIPIMPRAKVTDAAMVLARQIAQAPRGQLVRLKQQLTGYMHDRLEETYRLELAMHEKTFVGRSDTLARIEKNFHQESKAPAAIESPARALVSAAGPGDLLSSVAAALRMLLANELQMRESDIDDNSQFIDLGLDSISGLTWVRKINEKYHTAIEPIKVYSYPTLSQLSRFVKEEAEKLGPLVAPVAPPAVEIKSSKPALSLAQTTPKLPAKPAGQKLASRRGRRNARFVAGGPAPRSSEPIAVIGIAGQFPQARNVEEFWQNIQQGKNCITQISSERWDVDAYYQPGEAAAGKTYSRWMGTLDDYDRFDPSFFNISPVEAESMDPQQRLFLQACWHGIEDAGYNAQALSGSKCGVFVGCTTGHYHQLSQAHALSAQGFTGSASSILAARISYFLNLQGPCLAIDTACSSSLVAIAHACDSLVSGGSDLVLAGGVYVMGGPQLHIMTAQSGMLSPGGKCYTFDHRGDGFVPGEGVGVVLLKRLSDAQRNRDHIYGVIQGWGINQDGKTNGITAPNPESQTRLEQEVYDKYQIDPAAIQLIEAHGTGTKLGDPIEVEGLKKAFRKYTQSKEYCALGSVKSNIGHCATAAGIAGFIKALLALKHKQLPPTINFECLNEHIDLQNSPFYVNTRLQEWKLNGAAKRQAAISSFGFGGTNAHVVVGEYLLPVETPNVFPSVSQDSRVIVPLSARKLEQLRQKASDLRDFILRHRSTLNLSELAYTLQVGREAMDERAALLVSSIEQLVERLQAYVNNEQGIEDLFQGQVKRNREALSLFTTDPDLQQSIEKWIAGQRFSKLADLWVKGLDLAWNKFYGEIKPQRISLPSYPFAKERYWIEPETGASVTAGKAAIAVLHPLLHSNTSDLSEQRYSSTFTGEEFFLADHRLTAGKQAGQKVLPAAAYLEMARAAIEQAWRVRPEPAALELNNVAWSQPVIVEARKEINIALPASENDQTVFEIYSQENEQEVIHCQGIAHWRQGEAPARLNIDQLKAQMNQSKLETGSIYGTFAHSGLYYGPSFQSIAALHLGADQALACLRLPKTLEEKPSRYVLHPSLVEGALAAAVLLIKGVLETGRPVQPLALESLRIFSPCTGEMAAWVRHPEEKEAHNRIDIDLCDEFGNICAQMRGLTLHAVSLQIAAIASKEEAGSLLAAPVWQPADLALDDVCKMQFVEHHVVLCEMEQVSAAKLQSFLPQSQCLSLVTNNSRNIAERYRDYALACFERIQAIFQNQPQGKVLLQIVAANRSEHALFAGLSGLLKTAGLENPRFVGQIVLTAPETTAEELAKHLATEKSHALDPQVRYEQGTRQVLRWQEVLSGASHPQVVFKDRGVYLITGGLGALGLLFAKEILEQTRDARVVLTGRSAFDAEKQARLAQLTKDTGRLSYRQLAPDDLDEVRQVISSIQNEYGRLDGILHSAGTTADNYILRKTATEFREVLGPKVTGTFNLDDASQNLHLDFFVLFSSSAAVMGNLGQADYASANAFMDEFAAYRNRLVASQQRHGRTRSINWGLWQAGRMQIDPATQEMLKQITGIQTMQTATGLEAFYRSLTLSCDQLMVVEGAPAKIASYLQRAHIFTPPATTQANVSADDTSQRARPVLSLEQLQHDLKAILAAVLKIKAPVIDIDQSFVEFGLDSILGAEMIVAINKKFGTQMSNLKLFDYPNIREFSVFLEQEVKLLPFYSAEPAILPAGQPAAPVTDSCPVLRKKTRIGRTATGRQASSNDCIAIVGMSGRYPRANNLKQYWENLAAGRNCITEVPASRWDVNRYYDPDRACINTTYSKWLGALDDIDCFDPLFFRISPQEAEYMDPQHRLFLQESYRAFEDAGYSSSTLNNRKCGVYLGISTSDYESLLMRNRILPTAITSNSHAIAAARIAYYLNLKGPAISVDTACSSSLVAIHLACQALLSGETDMALAGGVTLWLTPESYLAMSQAGMFSPSGQCRTFDDSADGIVNGEGVGAVVLKRLKDAERDNDFIYGVILGSGINQDGRTNGITAPSVNSQIELERSIYAKHKINPETISYVETHGTGTKLGDPIELEALATVFKEKTAKKNFCALGSVKSNIGHTTSAAGVAGLQKVLLSLQHQTLVPSLNVKRENSHFNFADSPFYISRETKRWDAVPGSKRRAAVSSFGFSGTNAHMVIEEYIPPVEQIEPATSCIVPLSARNTEQLRQKAADLIEFISLSLASQKSLDLAAVAYTLQIGRDAMEERLGVVVSSLEQLVEKLSACLAGARTVEGLYQGRVEPGGQNVTMLGRDEDMQGAIDKWIARRKLPNLLDLWVCGLNFDWHKLYGDVKPRRISLPAYPFAKERYWIDELPANKAVSQRIQVDENMKSIEDIINEIDSDVIETDQAVQALKMLV